MVSGSFRCDPNRLRQLLEDRLPAEGQTELAEHIETCPACRRRLESLAADVKLWSQVGQLLRPEPEAGLPTSAVEGPDSQGGDASRPARGPANRRPPLDFLAPSDDPQQLGRLGPYEIVEVIGSGGMGVVLKGFDAALNRFVAIKVLAPHLASSAAARRRFAREAQAAAAVVHEHVIAIHAVDAAGATPYLVMPFVDGRSLQARLDANGPLELREILRIAAQTAAGLAAAHAQGLVHRDIKPANILLENGVERVMITDFGLARAIDDASLTQSGVVAGTPQYMAPEQAEGRTVDHRCDLFSLGSVIYAMCTGRSPFRAETTMAVLRRICEGTPRAIREINPEIPDWLSEIVGKLLEKDPAERFQSAAEVADLLGRHLAHLQQPAAVPIPARLKSDSASSRRARRGRRRRLAAGGALLLLAAGFVAAEMTGLTQVTAGVGRLLQQPTDEQPPEPTSPVGPGITAGVSRVSPSSNVAVSPQMLRLDGGFQDDVAEIRDGLLLLEARSRGWEDAEPSPDRLPVVRGRLAALEDELDDEARRGSADLLPAVAAGLAELEQDGHPAPTSDGSPIDQSLSNVGARLEMLEQDVRGDWR